MTVSNTTCPSSARLTSIIFMAVARLMWASGGLCTRLLPYDLWTIVFGRGVFATGFAGV